MQTVPRSLVLVEVDGYADGRQTVFWCPHEGRWHRHSRGSGPVTPHCVCDVSRFGVTAFVIHEVGEFTPEIRRAHPRQHPRCATCSSAPAAVAAA